MSVDASLANSPSASRVGRKGTFAGVLRALFSPSLVRFSRAVSWKTEPTVTNSKGLNTSSYAFSHRRETLSHGLFFDTYGRSLAVLPAARRSLGYVQRR